MPDKCPFEINPLSEPSLINNNKINNLNYTNQDFWSLKNKLVDFINERFGENGNTLPNTFNDLVEGSVAIMLMENWAYIADLLSFKIDQTVNELFIDTVTEADNAFRLCQLVGFKPTPPIPARSLWTATINATLSTDVILASPITIDVVSNDTPITIELYPADADNNPVFDQDIIIPAGSFVNSSIIGLEGKTIIDNFAGNGTTLQSYTVRYSSVIYDSVSVRIDGILWEKVDYFSDSQPRREYRVEYDSDYRAYIIFGNNRAGLSPPNGAQIEVTYRIGGGINGNIVTGYVEAQKLARVFGSEYNIPVFLRNYTKGEYGYDGDTIEDIRRKLPVYLRTQDRAVTGSDYKNLCDQFVTQYHGQIGKSNAVLRNHGCAGNVIDVFVLAKKDIDDLEEASDELKSDLANMLEESKMMTDFICIKNGEIIESDVSVEVTLSRINRKFEQEIKQNISNKITEFFKLYNWDYGQNLRESDLIRTLSSIKEPQGYDIVFTTNEVNNSGSTVLAKYYQIIRPADVTISFMYV
jgi:hypothetical protein